MSDRPYRLTVIAISDKQHPPIQIRFKIPEQLARLLMSQPVTACSLMVEQAPGIITDKSPLLDFR